jgi:hypothetical protein
MGNKFFATREGSAGNKDERIHFAVSLNRTLSLAEAAELRDTLTELLRDKKNLLPVEKNLSEAREAPLEENKPTWHLVDGKWQVKK